MSGTSIILMGIGGEELKKAEISKTLDRLLLMKDASRTMAFSGLVGTIEAMAKDGNETALYLIKCIARDIEKMKG